MWIRSQDKEMIMNCNALGIGLEDDKSIYSNGYVLGEYSTKEKALKVLDMIQEHITKNEAGIYNSKFGVYQMPQDSEVNANE